jgi:hypothetical protein
MVSFYKQRQSDITTYYSLDGALLYCNKNQKLMEGLQLEHTSGQWRRFIDSFKGSFKAVFYHSGNKFPSITLAFAVHMTEMFEKFRCCCK